MTYDFPEFCKGGQTRTAYAHGFKDALEGKEPRPYGGKLAQKAYAIGYEAGGYRRDAVEEASQGGN